MSGSKNTKTGATQQLSLREQLLGRLEADDSSPKRREVSVMTRMNGEIVDVLDALVELDIFASRSEAVSAFVTQAIKTRKDLFEEIQKQAREVRKMRDSAKQHAYEAFQEEKP